jgi:hypothetical protein
MRWSSIIVVLPTPGFYCRLAAARAADVAAAAKAMMARAQEFPLMEWFSLLSFL